MQTGNPDNYRWQVYLIEASDTKLYTGITTDIELRWQQHLAGKGAKFFRGRKPQRLCYLEFYADRGAASRREAEIKKMNRQQKQALIASRENYHNQAAPNTPAESPSSARTSLLRTSSEKI
jgi:putative endonuclease